MDSLKEFRERGRACTKRDYQTTMLGTADKLDKALDKLWRDPTRENLKVVNSFWAFANRLHERAPPEADPQPPMAGAPTAAQLAA